MSYVKRDEELRIIHSMAAMLVEVCERGDEIRVPGPSMREFSDGSPDPISVGTLNDMMVFVVDRVNELHSHVTKGKLEVNWDGDYSHGFRVLLCAMVYIERFLDLNPGFNLSSKVVCLFIITSVVVALKYLDDYAPDNEKSAHCFSIDLKILNECERKFCNGVAYDLRFDMDEYKYIIQHRI